MKKLILMCLVMIAAACMVAAGLANPRCRAQGVPLIVITDGKSYLAGEINVDAGLTTISNKVFSCVPVHPFKKGAVVAAQVSDDEGWSVETAQLAVGTRKVSFPVLALVHRQTVYPARLKVNLDIKPGVAIQMDGYEIESARSIKAGESIAVLVSSGSAMFSAESVGNGSKAKPAFSAYKAGTKSSERSAALRAWRTVKNHRRIGI